MLSLKCIIITTYDFKNTHKVQGCSLLCFPKLGTTITNWELKINNLNVPKSISTRQANQGPKTNVQAN